MHLLIPFAAPLPEAGREALRSLSLPNLRALLARLGPGVRDEGDEWSLTPPHERALARAIGWKGGDGALPFAAWKAAADGVSTADLAWGALTPVHWHLGTDQVSLMDPAQLQLDEATSRALFDGVSELFTSEGFAFVHGATGRWYAAHDSLAELRCASLDRVIGRNVDRWLTEAPAVRLIRRLQNEVQMTLYEHPINEAREARGLLPVNSFWLDGCGVTQPAAPMPTIDARLRAPALAEDWAAWVKAWDTLDEGPIAAATQALRAGQRVQLTLCGERSAIALTPPAASAWQRVQSLWHRPSPIALLESL